MFSIKVEAYLQRPILPEAAHLRGHDRASSVDQLIANFSWSPAWKRLSSSSGLIPATLQSFAKFLSATVSCGVPRRLRNSPICWWPLSCGNSSRKTNVGSFPEIQSSAALMAAGSR